MHNDCNSVLLSQFVKLLKVLVACLKKLEEENTLYYCFIDGDADSVIAGLAEELKCPVLSNDTDFILYDLPPQCGLILLDKVFISMIIERQVTNYLSQMGQKCYNQDVWDVLYSRRQYHAKHICFHFCGIFHSLLYFRGMFS